MSKIVIVFTPEYLELELKFLRKHRNLLDKYYKMLKILETNPFYPSLRTHKLHGRLNDFYSVSIDMQYRVLIKFVLRENQLIPVDIGDHDNVYTK